jgi:hypothetical protein
MKKYHSQAFNEEKRLRLRERERERERERGLVSHK